MPSKLLTLYAMQASLFSAKVRAWLKYNNVDFVEKSVGEEYLESIAPKVGRWIIPVVVTPNDEILQDGTDILDWLDKNVPNKGSIYPEEPVLRAIAHVFELFGGEGLLRPAMHYRWNFDQHNLSFLKVSFRDIFPTSIDSESAEMMFEHQVAKKMRKAACFFGVTEDTTTLIEEAYLEFLDLLEKHLKTYPFLLGTAPSIGDYSLFGPLFAHLGRDPYPLSIMQARAPNVFQWIERMQSPQTIENPIYQKANIYSFDGENIPDTLLALLTFVSEEYLPEISAHVAFANEWLSANPNIKPGEVGIEKPHPQVTLGMSEFDWRGTKIKTSVMIYRFYLLQRLTDHFHKLALDHQNTVKEAYRKVGLCNLLSLKTTRRVVRNQFKEVWE
ncbi:glutathione S-transferase family protein [Glaciecola petra]|uniref:Glutathione S-transferase family protein n=1 Tax=Glaciecola petra TaxID=3075602 RepID=A0ABU2ZVY0_9ALTE|nr:glutathione S-transferase family protein [Aestuariibacter sp. P117]MDT0596454.1 glutathione S-transferase family protein [Aestuariibacter sp. P117]